MIGTIQVKAEHTTNDINLFSTNFKDVTNFPLLYIGKSSYITNAQMHCGIDLDDNYLYNFHVGNNCAIAHDVKFVIGLNHDYKNVFIGNLGIEGISAPKKLNQKAK